MKIITWRSRPSIHNRIPYLANVVEQRYAEHDGHYGSFEENGEFEEWDALALQFTPHRVMQAIVGEPKAHLLLMEAGRGCCGRDSEGEYPALKVYRERADGTTPAEGRAAWCSKYWEEVKGKILRAVEGEGIGEVDVEAACSAEQTAHEPEWFVWNDIAGSVANGIRVLRRQKALNEQLATVIETTTEDALELF